MRAHTVTTATDPSRQRRRGARPTLGRTAVVAALLGVMLATTTVATGATGASPVPLSISIVGNHFVNGSGQTIRLLGVNSSSTEYACDQGWGYSSEPLTPATAAGIASWDADAVRVTLNEDCWLGINGQPSFGTQAGYQQAVEGWVDDLNAAGLYVILDLHWSAPGTTNADGQRAMPDDHSVAFWTSVASTFKADPAVVFDAFNEPFSPAADWSGAPAVSWSCWRNGGCPVPVINDTQSWSASTPTYTAVGMQALVNAIRAAGATEPILLGGLSYANDLSGFLANEPTDPLATPQIAASFHNYYGESCGTASCWNTTIAGVAASVPVVTGEFGQGFDCANPPTEPTSLTTFDTTYMDWADQAGVSYLAWQWLVLDSPTPACSSSAVTQNGGAANWYSLVSDYGGTPIAGDGTALHTHLASPATPPPTTGAVSGTVTDATTGRPVAGVNVRIWVPTSSQTDLVATTTNSAGAYTVANLAPGTYQLQFALGTYNTLWYPSSTTRGPTITVTAGQTLTANAAITPKAAPSTTVSGTVTNQAGGAAVAGATVTIYPTGSTTPTATATTGATGTWATTIVPAGTYQVSFAAPGYATAWYLNATSQAAATTVTVATGQTTTANQALTPTVGSVAGTITNQAGGAAIGGATVSVYPTGSATAAATTTTSTSGAYTLGNLAPGGYQLSVAASGYTAAWYLNASSQATATTIQVAAGQSAPANQALTAVQGAPTGTVSGTVTDSSTGLPVAGVNVRIWVPTSKQTDLVATTTNSAGVYTIANLAPGTYQLEFALGTYDTLWYPNSTTRGPTITVTAGQTLTANAAITPK